MLRRVMVGVRGLVPLWIWLAVSLTLLGIGTVGLVQRSREAARLRADGTAATATVSRETYAGKALPFGLGHHRTRISIWYDYHGTHTAELACGYFDDCPHDGETMTVWVDPGDPKHFVTGYGDLEDDDSGHWFLTIVGGAATALPLLILLTARMDGRMPPRRRIARRAARRAIDNAIADPPADPQGQPSRRRRFKASRGGRKRR